MDHISKERLAELRVTTAHADAKSIGYDFGEDATPEQIEDFQSYLAHFAAPRRDADGNLAKGHPCLACDEPLITGLLGFLDKGGFEWGLAHGEGHCRNCRWPATLYHFVKDRHGKDLVIITTVLLQIHPDQIELKETQS